MANFIIPNSFFGRVPTDYFSPSDDRMEIMNPWSYGPYHYTSYTPRRCHCPAHFPLGPMRRRRDHHHRASREDALRKLAPVRLSIRQVHDDDLLGFPAQCLYLMDGLSSALLSSSEDQESEKKYGGESSEETAKAPKDGNECKSPKTSDRPSAALENREEKNEQSSSTSKKEETHSNVVVVEEKAEGDKPFNVSLKLGDFPPDNVNVSVDGRMVTVKAKRDEEDDDGRWVRRSHVEYSFVMPENTPTDSLTSSFNTDGMLSITAAKKNESESALETEQKSEETTDVSRDDVLDDVQQHDNVTPVDKSSMDVETDHHHDEEKEKEAQS